MSLAAGSGWLAALSCCSPRQQRTLSPVVPVLVPLTVPQTAPQFISSVDVLAAEVPLSLTGELLSLVVITSATPSPSHMEISPSLSLLFHSNLSFSRLFSRPLQARGQRRDFLRGSGCRGSQAQVVLQ